MPLIPIKIPPGFYRNATQYQAKNRWYNGNLVRFSEGRLRPIGGWQRLATTQITKKGAVRELTITNGGTGYSGSGTLTATGGGGNPRRQGRGPGRGADQLQGGDRLRRGGHHRAGDRRDRLRRPLRHTRIRRGPQTNDGRIRSPHGRRGG